MQMYSRLRGVAIEFLLGSEPQIANDRGEAILSILAALTR